MEEERAKREVRKENSQESSQANLFQARELMKVAEPEIDSLKTICAHVSLGKSGEAYEPSIKIALFS